MTIGRFKFQPNQGRSFNSKNNDEGIVHLSGEELVGMALEQASMLESGELEVQRQKIERLAEIVGRLVEYCGPEQALEVCGLQYMLEVVK